MARLRPAIARLSRRCPPRTVSLTEAKREERAEVVALAHADQLEAPSSQPASRTLVATLVVVASVSVYFADPRLISDVTRALVSLALLAVAWLAPLPERHLQRATRIHGWLLARQRVVVPCLAVGAAMLSLALCHLVLQPIPHVADEVGYLFQAQVFASARLHVDAPPQPEFFTAHWVLAHDGKWFSLFPPGWPGLLALGVKLGLPTLVNPTLIGACVLVMHRLARRLIGEQQALTVALLSVASPFFLFMGGSFMSHPAALLFSSLAMLLWLRGSEERSLMAFALSGLCAGAGFLVRPLCATTLWVAAAVFFLLRNRTWRQLLGTMLSAAPLGAAAALYLLYNRAQSGAWMLSLVTLDSPRNRMGIGPEVGLSWAGFPTPGHSLFRGLLNLNHNIAVMGADLFGWPLTSLSVAILFVSLGRLRSAHWLALSSIAAVAFAHLFYWYHGVCFGARFYFSLLPFLLILTAEGLKEGPTLLHRLLPGTAVEQRRRFWTFVVLCFAFCLLVYTPMVSLLEPYHHKRTVSQDLERFVLASSIQRGLVFVGPGLYLYPPAFYANGLDPIHQSVVFALERGAEDERLVQRLPDSPTYHFTHDRQPEAWPESLDFLLRRGYVRDLKRSVWLRKLLQR